MFLSWQCRRAIAVPLIVSGRFNETGRRGVPHSADLFVCGIASILQSMEAQRNGLGIKLPGDDGRNLCSRWSMVFHGSSKSRL